MLPQRVCFFDGFLQMFRCHMGVDLGGGDVGMAEEFLDHAEVGAALEQMTGEAVAEFVGGDGPRVDPSGSGEFFKHHTELLPGDVAIGAVIGEEVGALLAAS